MTRSTIDAQGYPRVTIVTVCRNSSQTISKTIESVLQQTYANIEYVVVDGGSTDGTVDILRQFEPRFGGRMRWICEKDEGIYDAMNKGIRLASGVLIGIINSDDWYELDAVERVVQSFRQHGQAVYYGILRVVRDGREAMLKLVNHEFLHSEVVGHPAFFVASAIYRDHGVFSPQFSFAADFELMMRFIRCRVPFVQINHILANFTHGGQSTQYLSKTIEEYLRIRCQYGYLKRSAMRYRIMRNRISTFLERFC